MMPYRPQLVVFKDGTYGVRRRAWTGYEFRGLRRTHIWWSGRYLLPSQKRAYCTGTKLEAEAELVRLKRRYVPELADNGSPVQSDYV